MDVSIMVEGQAGLNWPRWRRLVPEVERLGFAGLYRSDHFTNASGPLEDSLEMVTSLTWLASHTERIRFGPLVAPVSFRDPVMLARQAATLADLSGGRFVLGLGAGWQDREHEMFGYDLGDRRRRADRLEEALDLTARLLRSEVPVTFEGRFYRLREAVLQPRPARPPQILVGGGGPRRILPMVARYADAWNVFGLAPEAFRERCALLDGLLAEHGRAPSDVRRTVMVGVFFGRDEAALEAALGRLRAHPAFAGKTTEAVVAALRARGALAGTPATLKGQLAELEEAGVQEVMAQWLALDDLDGLAAFAEATLG